MKKLNSLCKTVLPGLLLLMTCFQEYGQASSQSQIIINEISGGRHASYLNYISEITFSGGIMTVVDTDSQANWYDIKNIADIRFFRLKMTDVENNKMRAKGISLYPNPVTDYLRISSDNLNSGITTIQIIDFQGRIVLSGEYTDSENIIINNLSGLLSGIYLCRISNSNQTFTTRFIKK